MKNFKKVLALVLVLATLLGLATMASATEYKDADKIDTSYDEAIKVLDLIETMQGYPNGEFRPTANITREEAAKLIAIFDNKDADISTYYTSINPFADEKGRWGESYVGYGYRAGIIAGMNATTFAPTANVTGTQFLKMALVTLGYDQEAEGFVGSSWAVNVLSLARKLDLIDGLADGWKAEAALTREEAAQILLNTLKADTVEYAQEAKSANFKPTKVDGTWIFNGKLYLTVAGAVKTGDKLYKDFDLEVTTSYDAFERPYTKWSKGKDSVEVMKAPKATFTTKFNACDLLAELGVAKDDKDTNIVIDYVFTNGVNARGSELLTEANGDAYTLTEGFVVGYGNKTPYKSVSVNEGWGIWHHEYSTCAGPKAAEHGAQGTLTQVFYNGKDSEGNKHYVVTSIDTWLAKVQSVTKKTTSRDEHIKQDGAVKLETVWTINTNSYSKDHNENFAAYCLPNADCSKLHDFVNSRDNNGNMNVLTFDDPTGLAKDDYVLITYSWKTGDTGVQSVDVTEGKDGRLNGYKFGTVAENPSETRVDGEFVKDAVHFHLNYDWSKSNNFDTYTFYYDAYGNVIGMTEVDSTSKWGVLDGAYITYDKGKAVLNVEPVYVTDGKILEGTAKKMFGVEKFNGMTAADIIADTLLNSWWHIKDGENRLAFTPAYDHLFKISVDSEGVYTIEMAEYGKVLPLGNLWNNGTEIKFESKKPYIKSGATTVALSSDTQILVHNMDDTYSAYTGFKNTPSMIAHYAEYVLDEDGTIEVLYLTNDVYTTDSKFVAYVGESADRYGLELQLDGTVYFGLKVFVGGEEKTVYIEQKQMEDYFDAKFAPKFVPGFYEFQYVKVDGDEIVRAVKGPDTVNGLDHFTSSKEKHLAVATAATILDVEHDVIQLAGAEPYGFADNCAVYGIYKDEVVTDLKLEDVQELFDDDKTHTFYLTLKDDEVTTLYIVLKDND